MSILFLLAPISKGGPSLEVITLTEGRVSATSPGAPPPGLFLLYQEDVRDNKVLYKISAS